MNKYHQKYLKYKNKYLILKQQNNEQFGGKQNYPSSNPKCIPNCITSHSQSKINYVWLRTLGYGKLLKVEFEEPVNSGNWRIYDDKWWSVHCEKIQHTPDTLVKAHMKAFVDPGRFARMMFYFEDGTIREPDRHFWELEAEYFKDSKLC